MDNSLDCPLFAKVTDRPSNGKNSAKPRNSGILYARSEGLAPIRCASPTAGVMSGPSNGLHGSQCGNEYPRARLLPHDEEPVWSDGDACVAWLLPEDSTERSRQRAGHEGGNLPPGCGSRSVVGCVRAGKSGLRCRRLGRARRLLASEVSSRHGFLPKNLVRSSLALYSCRAHMPVCVFPRLP